VFDGDDDDDSAMNSRSPDVQVPIDFDVEVCPHFSMKLQSLLQQRLFQWMRIVISICGSDVYVREMYAQRYHWLLSPPSTHCIRRRNNTTDTAQTHSNR
jgi:hypothetical protein